MEIITVCGDEYSVPLELFVGDPVDAMGCPFKITSSSDKVTKFEPNHTDDQRKRKNTNLPTPCKVAK